MASANEISRERIRGLQEDLKKLVNNPESSDVVFVCKDEVEVHACRLLLTVRSSFFRKMLENGMAESGKSTVALPTIESTVFIIILKYLYTAELPEEDIHYSFRAVFYESDVSGKKSRSDTPLYQLDWKLLMKVVVAARYFMLDCLHHDILKRLRVDISGVVHQTTGIQTGIVLALKLSALCELILLWSGVEEVMIKCIDEIGSGLVCMLAFVDLRPAALLFLSEEALTYYLVNIRKISHQEAGKFSEWSPDEYLKLRTILLWCAVPSRNKSGHDVHSFDPVCLPGSSRVVHYLEGYGKPHQIFSTVDANTLSLDRKALMNAIDRKVLKSFLEMLELKSIHPELLFSVIKPLGILEPEVLSKAFGEQAVIGALWVKKRKISK